MFYDIILRLNPIALLAQLDRVSGYGPEGQGFESLTARHKKTRLYESTTLFFFYRTFKTSLWQNCNFTFYINWAILKLKGGAFMNKLDKAGKVLTKVDIIFSSLTFLASFVFPFLVNKESLRTLFSSGFIYWVIIISSMLALIAIVLFVIVSVIRSVYHKKIIIDKSIVFAHIINVIFSISLIFFIYEHDLGFIFA